MELTDIILAVSSAVGGGGIAQLLNWRLSKRKGAAEVKSSEIDNMGKAMEFYRTLTEEQTKHIEALNQRISSQDEKISLQQKELEALHEQVISLYRLIGRNAADIAAARKARLPKPPKPPKAKTAEEEKK